MHHPGDLIRTIKHKEGIVGLRKDGIIHVYYHEETEINVPLQIKMLDSFNEITGGKKSLFLFEAGPYVTVTNEARDHAIAMEDITPTLATAVLVRNLPHKLMADFYYKFNKPKQPYKVVREFDDGITWLLEFESKIINK